MAACVVGLGILPGIDMVAEDISIAFRCSMWRDCCSQCRAWLAYAPFTADGQLCPAGKAIVDSLFAEDEAGRIPIVGIAGSSGKTLVAKIVARLVHLSNKRVGLACSTGLFFDQRLVEKRDCATWTAAQKVLMNRTVETAVIVNGVTTILTEGLGYDRCQVGVVTNIKPEQHFGACYIETPEQVYNVVRTQVDVVLGNGAAVLNAADPLVAQMAELCDGEVIFFARDAELPVVVEHLKQGGRAVLLDGNGIALATGAGNLVLTKLTAIPLLGADRHSAQLEHVLAAVGAAWALGISPELIRAGIETFAVKRADVHVN